MLGEMPHATADNTLDVTRMITMPQTPRRAEMLHDSASGASSLAGLGEATLTAPMSTATRRAMRTAMLFDGHFAAEGRFYLP